MMTLCHGGPTAANTPGDDAERAGGEDVFSSINAKLYLVRPDNCLHFVSPIIALSSPLNANSHPQQKESEPGNGSQMPFDGNANSKRKGSRTNDDWPNETTSG